MEGICVSLEASHAFGILDKLFPTFPNEGKIVVNCSSRGDEDVDIVFKHKLFDGSLKRINKLAQQVGNYHNQEMCALR